MRARDTFGSGSWLPCVRPGWSAVTGSIVPQHLCSLGLQRHFAPVTATAGRAETGRGGSIASVGGSPAVLQPVGNCTLYTKARAEAAHPSLRLFFCRQSCWEGTCCLAFRWVARSQSVCCCVEVDVLDASVFSFFISPTCYGCWVRSGSACFASLSAGFCPQRTWCWWRRKMQRSSR